MSTKVKKQFEKWASSLNACESKLGKISKSLSKANLNPFILKQELLLANKTLKYLKLESLYPPPSLIQVINDECTQWTQEFWQRFTKECIRRGWEVHGTTNRRLINRGLFIALDGEKLIAEETNIKIAPYSPIVVKELSTTIDKLLPKKLNLKAFMNIIALAYDEIGGFGEISLEKVFRAAVFLSQKAAFWKGGNQARFIPLTRSMFRARISKLVENDLQDKKMRRLRFGTTVERKEAWEIYSPGEERVVQIGRIALI